jgi:hypothetical protein
VKKKTRVELETEIKSLEPYREAYYCLMHAHLPVVVESGEVWVTVVGLDRASGGVVIGINGQDCAVRWVQDARIEWHNGSDPYFREIASKLLPLQVAALERHEEHQKRRREALNALS